MRFTVDQELELFAESVRAALAGWEAPLEPVFGEWQDDRDDALAGRLAAAGWDDLGAEPELLGARRRRRGRARPRRRAPFVARRRDAGRPLQVGDRIRHGEGRRRTAVREPDARRDGHAARRAARPAARSGPASRLGVATLAYLAGLAAEAVDSAIAHARSREQFGAPLAALPAVQALLAEAALARDGLLLCAWSAAAPAAGFPADELAWAGGACCEVTARAHQVHGAIGFALEGGIHRFHRRAKTVQAWADAVLRELG